MTLVLCAGCQLKYSAMYVNNHKVLTDIYYTVSFCRFCHIDIPELSVECCQAIEASCL